MAGELGRRTFVTGSMFGAGILAQSRPAAASRSPQRRWHSPPPALARQGIAELPEVKLWFSDTGGTGEPLILLHPGTGSGMVWPYQQAAFSQAGYRVITYSRRGHAGSEAGPATDVGTAADDLDHLATFLELETFHLLGTAAGGFVAADYAVSFPERLRSLIIACSQGGVTDPAFREKIAALVPPALRQVPASIRELGPSYRAGNPEGTREWERLEHGSRSVPARIRQRFRNDMTWAMIARIKTPTLLIAGGADLLSPPTLMLDIAERLARVEFEVLPESGHSGYWEQPEAFNAIVVEFLRKNGASAARAAER